MNHKLFQNKVAVITGAGSGIGAVSARKLVEAGAKVAILSRTKEDLEELASELGKENTLVVPTDISKEQDIKNMYKQVIEKWGRLDLVVANAGVNGVWAPIDELTLQDWQKTIDINLTGTFLTIKYAVPHLKKSGGSIVVVSSVNGNRVFSNTGATAYSCTKSGQVVMTKMLALELAKHKIRLNAVCPGAIDTEIEKNTQRQDLEKEQEPVEYPEGMIPLTRGEPGKAAQVADLVFYLLSDQASHVTGTEVYIDGAESLMKA
jgi:NAD(P)-dependent dehydrogenase (short-subunit alcohol dehydrogenase family)